MVEPAPSCQGSEGSGSEPVTIEIWSKKVVPGRTSRALQPTTTRGDHREKSNLPSCTSWQSKTTVGHGRARTGRARDF